MSKISIVLPTYNGEKYLAKAIDSILAQSFTDWELIIVDDCSTDGTCDVISQYTKKDKRIKSIKNKVNSRVAKSLNNGFAKANGKYFTWTSDDNLLLPDALLEMSKVLDEKKQVDLVYADFNSIDENGNFLKTKKKKSPKHIFLSCIVGACFLYRRNIHETLNGYDTNIHLADDYNFWIRAYVAGFKFYHLNKTLYEYRTHSGNLSSGSGSAQKCQEINAAMTLEFLPKAQGFSKTYKAYIYLQRFFKGSWHENKIPLLKASARQNPLITLLYLPKVIWKCL